MTWLNLLFVLLVNAVPLYGVKYMDWSVGTVLMLYWLENLLIAVFTCARIALHRSLTRKRGHYRTGSLGSKVNGKPSSHGLLGEYAVIAFVFTLAHGIFVVAIVFLIGENRPEMTNWQFSAEQFRTGALQMLAVLSADFAVDALSLRSRSFAWIKAYVGQRLARVMVLHLAIIFGMFASSANAALAVLYVLIFLKTLWDLGAVYGSQKADAPPGEPPAAWTRKVANVAARDKGRAASIQAEWKQSRDQRQRDAIEDEQVMPA